MRLFRKLVSAWRDLFKVPTLKEIIAHEMEKAVNEENQCKQVILSHRFQQHMAQAKIEALNAWREKEMT